MPTFAQTLRQSSQDCPDRIAIHLVQAKQAGLPITYKELVQHSSAYAQLLEGAGVREGEVVVIILEHGEPLVYAFWGAALHGAVPSILPFLTEKLSPEKYLQDLAALIAVTHPAAILTYPAFAEKFAAQLGAMQSDVGRPKILTTDQVEHSAQGAAAQKRRSPLSAARPRAENDIALLQHSSGSTGLQKGVALSHRAVFNQLSAYAQAINLSADDVICSWLPLYHDMGLIASFVMPVLLRVPLVLLSPFDWVRAPAKLLQLISAYKGTLTWLPNFAYNFMAQKIRERDLEGVNLSSLRMCINCSEPTFAASHTLFAEKFAQYGLNPDALTTSYAMAENTFAVTQSAAPVSIETRHGASLLSAGKPLPNVRLRILSENRSDLPEGEVGEIAIQSDCMLTGYYHRDDLTVQVMHDGFFLTGDLGYQSNGELFVTGRKKDLIIVGGKNVYPQDVERLASEVPGVHPGRVVAFGVMNDAAGTEDVIVIAESDAAEVVSEETQYAVADAVRAHINKNTDVAVRVVQVVPPLWLLKTSSGKIARAANKSKYLAQAD
jgi:acyl-CoA synthetase (AMP-forming)/AMP-acid ligase II